MSVITSKNLGITKGSLTASSVTFLLVAILLLAQRQLGHRPDYSFMALGGMQFLLLMALNALASTAILFYARTKNILKEFFTAQTHPMNMAILRIVLCAKILSSGFNPAKAVWFSSLPKEFLYPPIGTRTLLKFLPIDPTLAAISFFLFKLFCCAALIGWCTRFSLWMTVLFGFYALGIPQFFGKVNHFHHLLWFLAILAASRCGDFLSLDAIFASWRRADRGDTRPPAPSLVYALPLRFIWILLGIIYFFPGFWKIWISGLQWITSDTMRNYMYYQWMGYDGWVSPVRVDLYPLICKMMGLCGVIFELTFIFLIFFPNLRWIPITLGLTFHTLTNVIMRIGFLDLQLSYVSFFEWQKIFNSMGCKLFPQEMYVIYDGNCKICRRTAASLRTFDILGRITYVNMFDASGMKRPELARLNPEALSRDMHVVEPTRVLKGFDGYRAMVFRLPLLWPILPFLFVWPITTLGRIIYRRVADSRTCSIKDRVKAAEQTPAPVYPLGRLTIFVGVFLIIGNLFFGAFKIGSGWPLACYPTFEEIPPENFYSMEISFTKPDGEESALNQYALSKNFPPERFMALMHKMLSAKEPRRTKLLTAFWKFLAQNNPQLQQARSVQFYRLDLYIIPEKKHLNPISRNLILKIDLDKAEER